MVKTVNEAVTSRP